MIINQLKIKNFRNYHDVSIRFDKGIHMLTGKNGQGKTNLLESIYYLSCTKSHRVNSSVELITSNCAFFILEASMIKENRKVDLKCIVNEEGKNLFLYKNPLKKVSEFIGVMNAVMFSPNDMNLFDSNPKERRKFVDIELSKLSKAYMNTLNRYHKILKERNAYLKKGAVDRKFIEILDDQLIEDQLIIIRQRKKFIDDMIENSIVFYQQLSNDDTRISYQYMSVVAYDESDRMKQALKQKYVKSYERDIIYQKTHIGIHKDDYLFMINEKEVSLFASQGQKRSILLALKLGIVETIYTLIKEYPILLLDDVFSELDGNRRSRLLSLLNDDMQIFISATDRIEIDENRNIHYWKVDHGNIEIEEDEIW